MTKLWCIDSQNRAPLYRRDFRGPIADFRLLSMRSGPRTFWGEFFCYRPEAALGDNQQINCRWLY